MLYENFMMTIAYNLLCYYYCCCLKTDLSG